MNEAIDRLGGLRAAALGAIAVLALSACTQGPEDRTGNEMRSNSTGERNERLGNDPAQQNTGGDSNPEDRALRENSAPPPR